LRRPSKLGAFMLHVERPNNLVSPINHQRESDSGANVYVFQTIDHLTRAVVHEQRINDYQRQTKLRWSELQITDLESIGRGEREKRAHFVAGTERQHDEDLVAGAFGEDERVTDDHRAQEEVVEEVIHVITPPDQARAAILAY